VTVDIQLLLPACLIAKADRAVQDYDCIQIWYDYIMEVIFNHNIWAP
jgi:hypothetical protein